MKNNNYYNVLVIGGGAAGMMAAISAVREGATSVAIIEHKDQLGTKLLSTGNGHCNYTNSDMSADKYSSRTADRRFVEAALDIFGYADTVDFFYKLGIEPFEKNGYIYPYSMQAKSVREALTLEIKRLGIQVHTKENIERICNGQSYRVFTSQCEYVADSLVIAVGGVSAPKTGSDGSLYKIISGLSKKIFFVEQLPALCPLATNFEYISRLSGVRTFAKVTIGDNAEVGEIQFGDKCISGIVVFNLSNAANINRNIDDVLVDYFPTISNEQLLNKLRLRFKDYGNGKNAKECMIGLLPDKLSEVALSIARIPATAPASTIDDDLILKLCNILKAMNFGKCFSDDYSKAQLTSGGIDLSNISVGKLDAFGEEGLFFAGEIMDIQGPCGGYNLQWAWTSGYLAGQAAAKRSQKC